MPLHGRLGTKVSTPGNIVPGFDANPTGVLGNFPSTLGDLVLGVGVIARSVYLFVTLDEGVFGDVPTSSDSLVVTQVVILDESDPLKVNDVPITSDALNTAGTISIDDGIIPPLFDSISTIISYGLQRGGQIPFLRYKVIDPFGKVVIKELPHKHTSKWTVNGMMPGEVGATNIGTFSIPLHDPGSPEWMLAQQEYSRLTINQRIEGYYGDVEAGDPKVTGLIRELPTSFNEYSIKGADSLALLQLGTSGRKETFTGLTSALAVASLKAYDWKVLDDFKGDLSQWTNPGGWTLATSPINLPAVQASSAADGLLYTTASFDNTVYADCYVDGWFSIQSTNPVNGGCEAGLVAALTDTNNFILGRAQARRVTANRLEIDAELWTKIAGNYLRVKHVLSAITTPTMTQSVKVTLRGLQNGPNYTWRVLLNGTDVGCTYTYIKTPSGSVGARASLSGIIANSNTWMSNFSFIYKRNVFNPGRIQVGNKVITQVFSNTPLIDILNISAVTEGVAWRKVPKPFVDIIDWGPAVGTNLVNQIHFNEGVNLDPQSNLQANSDPPITVGRLLASPGQDNGGFIEWVDIPQVKKFGYIVGNVNASDISDVNAQQALIQKITRLRATPGQGKRLFVYRDLDTADQWREQDFVSVNSSRLGLFNATVQVMGWTLEEGKPTQEIVGDQYPKDMIVSDLRTMRQELDALATGTMDLSISSSDGSSAYTYDSRYGTPTLIRTSASLQSVDGTYRHKNRFEIPQTNVAGIQIIRVSFTLQPFRAAVQPSAAAEAAHTHNVPGGSHSHSVSGTTTGAEGIAHSHGLFINSGIGNSNVTFTNGGGALQAGVDGGVNVSIFTTGETTNHQHNLGGQTALAASGGTTTSNSTSSHGHTLANPTGLFETGMAKGTRIFVDGVDVTSSLSGPWGTGGSLDVNDLDITPYIDGTGWHEVQLSSTAIGAISSTVDLLCVIKGF